MEGATNWTVLDPARRTATPAPAAIGYARPISTNLPAGPGFNTSTGKVIEAVFCGRAARTTRIVASPATRTKHMAERMAARPDLLDRRGASVEHPFGSIKQWMGHGAFLTRQLSSV